MLKTTFRKLGNYLRSQEMKLNNLTQKWRMKFGNSFRKRLRRSALILPDRVLKKYLADLFGNAAAALGKNPEYVAPLAEKIDFSRAPLRLIAFYLPQFHPTPENDLWWGKGFTEWTNVSKAVPQYLGHYQPRLPGELGFYDLRLEEVQQRQIELAKQYGIQGFCYYHYWFGGKRILDRPFQQILQNKELDFPFCLCWANENWTRRWDGLEKDVLIAQNHSAEDDIAFIESIADALRDPRYIRVDGKPLLIVYRVSLLPDAGATIKRWRDYCANAGIGDLYIVAARAFDIADDHLDGFDASVEFPPHQARLSRIEGKLNILNANFAGEVNDFGELADFYKSGRSGDRPLIKTVSPGWDNEARKPGRGRSFYGASPAAYASWLRSACQITLDERADNPQRPDLVFINAWNEWAEGAYLEPDRRFGYAYLHTTANVLRSMTPPSEEVLRRIEQNNLGFRKSSDTAIVLHLFYLDLLEEFARSVSSAPRADLWLTLNENITPDELERVVAVFPSARISLCPNRGRDIYPFLLTLNSLIEMNYVYGCKIHTKKSLNRDDGASLRNRSLVSLLGRNERVHEVLQRFAEDKDLGIIAPHDSVLKLGVHDRYASNRAWLDRLLPRLGLEKLVGNYRCEFVAGSMFWFRVDALRSLAQLGLKLDDFEEELGQADGTLAHALERVMIASAQSRGFRYAKI